MDTEARSLGAPRRLMYRCSKVLGRRPISHDIRRVERVRDDMIVVTEPRNHFVSPALKLRVNLKSGEVSLLTKGAKEGALIEHHVCGQSARFMYAD